MVSFGVILGHFTLQIMGATFCTNIITTIRVTHGQVSSCRGFTFFTIGHLWGELGGLGTQFFGSSLIECGGLLGVFIGPKVFGPFYLHNRKTIHGTMWVMVLYRVVTSFKHIFSGNGLINSGTFMVVIRFIQLYQVTIWVFWGFYGTRGRGFIFHGFTTLGRFPITRVSFKVFLHFFK